MKKNINSIVLAISLLLTFSIMSCSVDEAPMYEGESLLHFNQGNSTTAFVQLNTGSQHYNVTYGVTNEVSSEHSVQLVFDQSKSTAILGTDFTIVKGIDDLKPGEVIGDFVILVTEAAATAGKKAVFTLQSSTIPYASFKQEQEVTFKLSCPLDNSFPLTYLVDVYAFNEFGPSHQQTLTRVEGTDNQFKVTSSWGPEFVAWATNDPGYLNQYLHDGILTINCTDVTFTSTLAWSKGGTGTYDPNTGIIELTVGQSLFSGNPFTVKLTFNPM